MEKFIEHLTRLKNIYGSIVIIVGLVSGVFTAYLNLMDKYDDILENIKTNTVVVETTQITMLKSIVREFEEKHDCIISDAEWDEYMLNYSKLFDLKVRHTCGKSKLIDTHCHCWPELRNHGSRESVRILIHPDIMSIGIGNS